MSFISFFPKAHFTSYLICLQIKKKRRIVRCLETDDDEKSESLESKDCVKRIKSDIFFYAPINRETIQKLVYELEEARLCGFQNDKSVRVFIHSEGGDIYAGLSGMNHIQKYDSITTIADGFVASAATFLLLGGKTRIAMPDSTILIHQLTTEFWGKYADLLDEMKNSMQLMKKLQSMYKKRTLLDDTKVKRLLKKELTISSKKSLKWGIVDKIGL